MNCALLTIGTELTRGELIDSNSAWLAEKLCDLGHEVTTMLTVDDNDERIVQALHELSRSHQVLICTGGLGPTTDDRTTACVAKSLNLPLVRDQHSLDKIEDLFASFGRSMAPSNAKQADFPQGAVPLPNSRGTAPGFSIKMGACLAFFTPGVPSEMHAMFEECILPQLPQSSRPVFAIRIRSFGMPESEVNDRLAGLEEAHDVTIGYRASQSEIEVKVLAQAKLNESRKELEDRCENVASIIEERIASAVYARGTTSLSQHVASLLVIKGLSLGLAESCTGGLVSEMITQVPGASRFFQGAVVSYANSVKMGILGVYPELLDTQGAVSAEVVCAMAVGARNALACDLSLALSGVAGPAGGTEEKPVGLVHWAISSSSGTKSYERVFHGTRSQIQRRAALSALWTLNLYLRGDISLSPEDSD